MLECLLLRLELYVVCLDVHAVFYKFIQFNEYLMLNLNIIDEKNPHVETFLRKSISISIT